MAFVIDDIHLPAILNGLPMTDEEFSVFCAEHPDLSFETTAEGELIVTAPTDFLTGARNSEIAAVVSPWARNDRRGIACDSSTGFVLPNGARRSPDASWVLKNRVSQMSADVKDSFLHLCPDFVIELNQKAIALNF